MIASFGDKTAQDIYNGTNSREARSIPPNLWNVAVRKLDMVNTAQVLDDLLAPPGNRLEALKGNLKGFHSIRINDRYRIIFKWTNNSAENVKILDYH